MDPHIAELLDDVDPRNALTAYYELIFIAILFRIFLIIIPLWKAYVKFSKRGVISRLLKVRKLSSIEGIFGFLCIESSLLALPLLVTGLFRWAVGDPSELTWSVWQLSLAVLFGTIWLLVDLNRTLNVNRSLKPLQQLYTHPHIVNASLETFIWSRNKLQSFSEYEFEPEPAPESEYTSIDSTPVIIRNEDGKIEGIDTDVLISKADDVGENVGVFLEKAGHHIREKIGLTREKIAEKSELGVKTLDGKLQEKVENITNQEGRWKDFLSDITMCIYPLIIIWYLLPMLG